MVSLSSLILLGATGCCRDEVNISLVPIIISWFIAENMLRVKHKVMMLAFFCEQVDESPFSGDDI